MLQVNPVDGGVRIEGKTKWADFSVTFNERGEVVSSVCIVKSVTKPEKKDCGCKKRKDPKTDRR